MAAIVEPLGAARNRPFGATLLTDYLGDPLPITGATAIMEVRLYPGAAGAALASDADVTMVDVGQIGTMVDPADGVSKPLRRLRLEPSIPMEAIRDLPGQNAPEAGDPQSFSYEVLIEYADGLRDPLWLGEFIVEAGVVAP
ncbi:hypothetical protein [Sphingomonas sanxanigenens]|uniref:Uncharacterized protein n=1 Tax=Sphingomonas sanxanigenens DSM 19645 = NX02 TaxID=1123269 RepID=W0AEM8_9SPHN|nr:hypothetical protein [Sphingomonas sanxanigenens]AHE55546.1 hypothetical protein NX02_19430 [Sphingomonas sanxanigenens DSM 19645 = NX02]